MRAHLHLHLEPNERKRRQSGRQKIRYASSADFFDEHDLSSPGRLPVTWDDLAGFLAELHGEQRAQGVDYAEVRLSPRRFLPRLGLLPELLAAASGAAVALADPVLRLILLINRDSPADLVDSCESAIADGLPTAFVGIDLAGDEIRFPEIGKFVRCFAAARSAGLGVTVHAGEFAGPRGIWEALDRLGANRIGHGVSAAGCIGLGRRLRRDDVMIEASITSNVALGAVRSAAEHPVRWFVANDVPVCPNADVPLHLGTTLDDERAAWAGLLGLDLTAVAAIERAAAHHRFGPGPR